ncbi:hypothetical protein [Streptomyces crystallinus]|uniref:Uncharacterized protein n=1 Tax=Streptomyces crystallinus TaxID=68191 RepID=A0ABP3RZQ3_9ACTN
MTHSASPSEAWAACHALAVRIYRVAGEDPRESADRVRRRTTWNLHTSDTDTLVTTLIALALHSAALDVAHERQTSTAAGIKEIPLDIPLNTIAEHLHSRPRHEFFAGAPTLNAQAPATKAVAALRLLAYTDKRPAPLTMEHLAIDARLTVLAAARSAHPEGTAGSL